LEPSSGIKAACGSVFFVDLEEDGAYSEASQAPQMQIENAAGKPASAPRCGDRNR
jgi:hypothetical protein